MSAPEEGSETDVGGRRYRVVERFRWIEGGKLGPLGRLEGGRDVGYEPGQTVYVEDAELRGVYRYVEAIDDAGRAALEEVRESRKARNIAFASFPTAQRSAIAQNRVF